MSDLILHWPQYVYLAMCALSAVTAIARHGEARDPFNGPATFVAAGAIIWLLYMGGFFTGGQP